MKHFEKIGQFRDVIRLVRDQHDFQGLDENGQAIMNHLTPYPTITFTGTVKLHGTNSGVEFDGDGNYTCQSRTRVIEPGDDNMGFARFISEIPDDSPLFSVLRNGTLYGEWCGSGIQKSVAICELPKMFVLFSYFTDRFHNIDDLELSDDDLIALNEQNIYTINQFKQYKVTVDFNDPKASLEELQSIVDEIEGQCPVGKHFDVEGVGEGVVFSTPEQDLFFKCKGEKHSVRKAKTAVAIDPEVLNSINEFVEMTVTENRLNQGLSWLTSLGLDVDVKQTGVFMKWIVNDILSEELDVIKSSGLETKQVTKALSAKARKWWFNKIDETIA